MANHCLNTIVFSGEKLSEFRIVLKEIKEMMAKGHGWIPNGYTTDSFYHHMFAVEINDNEYDIGVTCWTKWMPPIDEILFLCRDIRVDFTMFYEELGMHVYGQCAYDSSTNEFEDVSLTDDDFKRVGCNDDGDWTFDGEFIESRYDAFEEMLNNKLKQIN